ncbi:MAG: PLP-dependent aminotransferase family protein [Candidatus Promineifilaceae bacterium]|nr:PLP-dependent aminotransferase family protein [Candidatus Promineifilaceae bacterium]
MRDSPPHTFTLSFIHLDREANAPLYRQIYSGLREAILQRRLAPGVRLPSTRDMADLFDVSRNTVVNAFEQLMAEGYVEARVGSGTYVTDRLPEAFLQAYRSEPPVRLHDGVRTLSRRGQSFARHYRSPARPLNHSLFLHGRPDVSAFPFETWARLAAKRYRDLPRRLFGYSRHPAGYRPLREAIAGYLRTARALRCEPEQIVIVSGSQEGLYLAGQVLLDPGDRAWIEDPGYMGARSALLCADAELCPIPVDDGGIDVDAGVEKAAGARVAYVTPSHQFPLGGTMSLARRSRLLQWSAASDAWILEDDYDSEFRYKGPPLASLQGLDVNRRVIYAGTFSKVLFPALRLGYLVIPGDLVEAFLVARSVVHLNAPIFEQVVLVDFMDGGHFNTHVRRMRTHYQERRDVFVEAAERELGGCLELGPADAGLHVTGWLPAGVDDEAVARRASELGIAVLPLSRLCLAQPPRPGLVMGFGAARPEAIPDGVRRLGQAITEVVEKGKECRERDML